MFRIPTDRINWTTSAFLIGTFVLTLTAVPLYLWHFGFDWFHFAVAAMLLVATGFSITLGYHRLFSHAHTGWFFFKLWPQPPFDNVADLKKDPLVMWQHRHIHLLAVLMSFVLPTLAGFLWDGWIGALGGFLIGGVAKVVVLQH